MIYARVSTTEQAEKALSIPAQSRHAKEYASRKGYAVAGVYEEHGVSGTTANRPVFNEMLSDIMAPSADVDAVLVYMSSRFMRSVAESQAKKAMLAKHGIRVISSSQETPDGPLGEAFDVFTELWDQLESTMIGVRTRSGLTKNAKQGWFPGSRAPFGFMRESVLVGKATRWKLIPNHEEDTTHNEVFREYVGGLGGKTTARNLNQRGLTYQGKPWSKDKVMNVIGETAAIGAYYWGKKDNKNGLWRERDEWIAIPVKPIIDHELFEMAQRVRTEREPDRNVGRTGSSPLLLAGRVSCGKCGASFQLETSGKLNAQGIRPYRYYNCRTATRVGKEHCGGSRISTEKLEQAVLDHIATEVFTESVCRQLIESLIEETGALREKTAMQRRSLRKALEQTEKSVARWQVAFENGDLPADLGVERLRELKARKAELEETLGKVVALKPPP